MIAGIGAILSVWCSILVTLRQLWPRRKPTPHDVRVAFLHPHCAAGGGGERVLWTAVIALQRSFPKATITVYARNDGLSAEQIVDRAEHTFGLKILGPVNFIWLWSGPLIEVQWLPRLTLALQAIGMFLLGAECVLRLRPDLVIDSVGCAFSYPVFWLCNIPIMAYVHYPFIRAEMISEAYRDDPAAQGTPPASHPSLLATLKLPYYRMLAAGYGACGSAADFAILNSSWTKSQIDFLWGPRVPKNVLYPPCDLGKMQLFDVSSAREPIIMSLSQFRPEKNHHMQIKIMARLFELRPEWKGRVTLVMAGGCRNKHDHARVESARRLAEHLRVHDCVRFVVNPDHKQVLELLSQATIGLHTMTDEHFGIGIVEFMGSGLVPVAHNSGGPRTDIIRGDNEGFLCGSVDEYAKKIEMVLSMPEPSIQQIRATTRTSALDRFTSASFEAGFVATCSTLLPELCK